MVLRLRADGQFNGARFYVIFMAIAPGEGSPIPSQSWTSDFDIFCRALAPSCWGLARS